MKDILLAITLFFSANTFANNEELIPVLIKYRDNSSVPLVNANQVGVRQLFAKSLRQQTKKNESSVLRNLKIQSENRLTTVWLINSSLAFLTKSEIQSIEALPEVAFVQPRRRAHLVLDQDSHLNILQNSFTYGLSKIGVPEIRSRHPDLLGKGVTVGIIDTGIDANHPDLTGKVKLFRNFISPGNKQPIDDHGHGTHVAGTIAGGATSGEAIGIAPDAKLIVAKTFSKYGGSDDSDLLLSLQWMADPDGLPETLDQPQVVSNSWEVDGSFSQKNPSDEPFCIAAENLAQLGVAVVFAAGNSGSGSDTIQIPAACPQVVSVGSTDENDNIASTSSRGPTRWKSIMLMKPEISAPGVYIKSAAAGGGYSTKSGTSMATPHVAGSLALLAQAKPGLQVNEMRELLFRTSHDLGVEGQDPAFGFGRVDIFQAVQNLPASSNIIR